MWSECSNALPVFIQCRHVPRTGITRPESHRGVKPCLGTAFSTACIHQTELNRLPPGIWLRSGDSKTATGQPEAPQALDAPQGYASEGRRVNTT